MRVPTRHVRRLQAPRQPARLAPHREVHPAPSAPAPRSTSPVTFFTDGRTTSANISDIESRSLERQARRRRPASRPNRSSKSFRTSRTEVRSAPSPRLPPRQAPHTPRCSTSRCSRSACSPRPASSVERCRIGPAESSRKGPLLPERARLKRVSDALQAASKVFDTTGEVFFRSLTEHLNAVLHVDYVS